MNIAKSIGIAAVVAAVLVTVQSYAQFTSGAGNSPSRHYRLNLGTLVDGLTLDTSRTFNINDLPAETGQLTLLMNLSGQSGVTRVDVQCYGSDDDGSTDYAIQSADVTSGAATLSDAIARKTVSAADQWAVRLDTLGFEDLECTVSAGAGTGDPNDIVSVKGSLSSQ